jgi:hypothetical protein
MAVKKYLDKTGVEHIADYVNRKLTVVSSMPSSPVDGQTVLYIGETTETFIQGGIYSYDDTSSKWVLISSVDVDLTNYETSWTGTGDEWNALSAEEQAKYEIVNITDDFVESSEVDGVVAGYYYDGKFYEDQSHTTEMAGLIGYIYIDLTEDKLYLYDGTNFVLNSADVDLEDYETSWTGTQAEWTALSPTEQAKYEIVNFTDDYEETGFIIRGYYYDGKFYEESTHTTEITPDTEALYVSIDTWNIYLYDVVSSDYVVVGGGNENPEFTGTQAEWDALTTEQKAVFDFINITDDVSPVSYKPGHSISDGTAEKTQRDVLVFEGFTVTDDSTNEVTKVAEVPYTAGDGVDITDKEISLTDEISRTWTGTKAEWNAIVDKSVYDGWIVNITDDTAVGSGPVVDVVEDGNLNAVTSNAVYDITNNPYPRGYVEVVANNETYSSLLGRLYALVDKTKVSCQSKLIHMYTTGSIETMTLRDINATYLRFYSVAPVSGNSGMTLYIAVPASSNSNGYHLMINASGAAVTDDSSVIINDGRTLRLVY